MAASRRERIILDTNLWISFLITKDFSKLDKTLFSHKATLIFSEELLEEFITVAKRLKFRKHFSSKDNFLLSLSVDENADFLITGDKDLLELKVIHKTKIVTITEYLKN